MSSDEHDDDVRVEKQQMLSWSVFVVIKFESKFRKLYIHANGNIMYHRQKLEQFQLVH